MRSLLAAAAAAWFIYNALAFIPQGAGVVANPGQIGGLDFVGLALVALALIEWDRIPGIFRNL